jgi:hypothetical protein
MEAHAHLCFNGEPNWRQVYDADSPVRMALRMAGNGRTMLEAGITTVRDLGAPTATSIEVRDAFAKGLVAGPDLLVAGAPITTTGGHCHFMGGEADGELEVRRAARTREGRLRLDQGHGHGRQHDAARGTLAAQYTVPGARLHRGGPPLARAAAHCHGTGAAVEAGVDMLEHCSSPARAASTSIRGRRGNRREGDHRLAHGLDRVAEMGRRRTPARPRRRPQDDVQRADAK